MMIAKRIGRVRKRYKKVSSEPGSESSDVYEVHKEHTKRSLSARVVDNRFGDDRSDGEFDPAK